MATYEDYEELQGSQNISNCKLYQISNFIQFQI